ncbi:hypothetical protein LRS05_12290 [Flavobacterium sp. J372]|uniref:hypothetical protein n=1 Tax=Flavobacterium sp. J372 TaxID=2898436 RepID=UPI002151EF94|nr:hypothetical protein [Flavobacterium sp. J372]MCR5862861.1 hypothetical protein [Flavobacterium sp. J372]
MERIILRSESKENIKLLADLARKIGVEVEYTDGNDDLQSVAEPEELAEWNRLTPAQQQGLIDAYEDGKVSDGEDVENVIRELRKRYE